MFGLGFGELLLILAVALIVLGPKKLPGVAQALGRGLAELRKVTDDVQKTVQKEIHAPLKEDILKDLQIARAQVKAGPPPGEADATAPLPQEPKLPEAPPPDPPRTGA
jgi:Tat protein translocase TatB subunit